MSAVMAFAMLFVVAMVAVFVKSVQMAVGGMPAWQAVHHIPAAKVVLR